MGVWSGVSECHKLTCVLPPQFVRPESELVRYDLVTEAQGSAYKRDRFLILFSDVLVCASARRKSTGLRRGSLL